MPKDFNTETYASIDLREYHEYVDRARSLYPDNPKRRFEYAEKIMPGQIYLFYIINELQEATMGSAYGYGNHKRVDEVTFSTGDIETLFRAIGFMIERMHDGLPEGNYDYIKGKSRSFFRVLTNAVEDNIRITEEA